MIEVLEILLLINTSISKLDRSLSRDNGSNDSTATIDYYCVDKQRRDILEGEGVVRLSAKVNMNSYVQLARIFLLLLLPRGAE